MRDEDYINTMRRNYCQSSNLFSYGILDGLFKNFHKTISWTKSVIRLIGCVFGIFLRIDIAFALFGLAEILGIIEEVKE